MNVLEETLIGSTVTPTRCAWCNPSDVFSRLWPFRINLCRCVFRSRIQQAALQRLDLRDKVVRKAEEDRDVAVADAEQQNVAARELITELSAATTSVKTRALETQQEAQVLRTELEHSAAENEAVRATLSAALAGKDAANKQLNAHRTLETERAAELAALSDTVEQAEKQSAAAMEELSRKIEELSHKLCASEEAREAAVTDAETARSTAADALQAAEAANGAKAETEAELKVQQAAIANAKEKLESGAIIRSSTIQAGRKITQPQQQPP